MGAAFAHGRFNNVVYGLVLTLFLSLTTRRATRPSSCASQGMGTSPHLSHCRSVLLSYLAEQRSGVVCIPKEFHCCGLA